MIRELLMLVALFFFITGTGLVSRGFWLLAYSLLRR